MRHCPNCRTTWQSARQGLRQVAASASRMEDEAASPRRRIPLSSICQRFGLFHAFGTASDSTCTDAAWRVFCFFRLSLALSRRLRTDYCKTCLQVSSAGSLFRTTRMALLRSEPGICTGRYSILSS